MSSRIMDDKNIRICSTNWQLSKFTLTSLPWGQLIAELLANLPIVQAQRNRLKSYQRRSHRLR